MASKAESKIKVPTGSEGGGVNTTGSRLLFLITITLALFAGATYLALDQDPKPNAYTQPTLWESIYYPQEKNTFMRLPSINGDLNDIFVLPNGEKLWAVGERGLIIHSPDGGKTWQQQNYPGAEQLSQIYQPTINTTLFDAPINFSLFATAHAEDQNTDPKQITPRQTTRSKIDVKALELERSKTRQEYQQQQYQQQQQQQQQQVRQIQTPEPQQQEEQTIIEEEPPAIELPLIQKRLPRLEAVYFVNETTGFIVGNSGTILNTTDGGKHWQIQNSPTQQWLTSVTFNNDGLQGWAVGAGGTILATSDGGKQWQIQNSSTQQGLTSVTVNNDGLRGWAVGGDGAILATSDGGKQWQIQNSSTQQGLTSVTVNNDGLRGWAVGGDGAILATSDGGKQWQIQNSPTQQGLTSVTFNNDGLQGWAVGGGGAILFTSDGGKQWQIQNSPTRQRLTSVTFNNDGLRGWAVGEGGTILATIDGGKHWQIQNSSTQQWLDSITLNNEGQRGWAVGEGGTILATSDGGKQWQIHNSPTQQGLYSITLNNDGQRGWAVGEGGTILATSDGGKQWQIQNSSTQQWLTSVTFNNDGQRGWAVGAGGTILATSDGGKQWQIQNSSTQQTLASVTFDNDGQRGWAVGGGGIILATSDGGKQWQIQNSPTQQGLLSVTFSNDGLRGWVAGQKSTIFLTTDNGKTWQQPQYQRTPARWYWLLCFFLSLFALWLIAKKPSVVSQPKETVADLLASDKPLEPGDPDPLNFNAIAFGLSRFMRNPATEPPLTTAITGAWGSGKSSLMNLLYHDLKSYGFTPVWFNAWHHQKGEQLLASLYANIKDQAIPSWFKFYKLMPVGLIFRLNLLAKRIKHHWLLTVISLVLTLFIVQFIVQNELSWVDFSPKKLLDSFFGEANGSFENLLILILGGPITILIRWLQAFGISPEKLMTNRGENKSNGHKLDPSARQAFAKEFKEVSSCLDTGRMVIFIDDLDRCSKENVVDILEAMNFLSVSGNCYIVVGMDETWVKICIENNFPDMVKERENGGDEKSFADNYLEKMINIPVPIPTLKKADTLSLLLPQDTFIPPLSLFNRISLTASITLKRYRVIFVLLLCAVFISLVTELIPDRLFLTAETEQTKPEKLYEWNNVSVDQFSVVEGKPEIQIAIDQSIDHQGLTNQGLTDGKQKDPQWQLILEGNPGLLDKGVTIATLGDKNNSANLILRASKATNEKMSINPETSSLNSDSPKETEKITKAGLTPGSPDSAINDYWLPLVSLVIFLFGIVVYGLKIPSRFVEDSPHFKEALSIWQPWISLQRSTPRAIKRYVNYVRYLAMRYKTPEPDKTAQERLVELFNRAPPQQEAQFQDINEETLVALSAIYAIEPDWLTDSGQLGKLKEGFMQQMVDDKFKTDSGFTDTEQVKTARDALLSSITRHQKKFGTSAFSDATVERFLDINSNTRFN